MNLICNIRISFKSLGLSSNKVWMMWWLFLILNKKKKEIISFYILDTFVYRTLIVSTYWKDSKFLSYFHRYLKKNCDLLTNRPVLLRISVSGGVENWTKSVQKYHFNNLTKSGQKYHFIAQLILFSKNIELLTYAVIPISLLFGVIFEFIEMDRDIYSPSLAPLNHASQISLWDWLRIKIVFVKA